MEIYSAEPDLARLPETPYAGVFGGDGLSGRHDAAPGVISTGAVQGRIPFQANHAKAN